MKLNNTQIVILAGGRGTRLKTLTNNMPKPMVQIHDKPFLEILLRLLQNKGFSKFLLLTGYMNNIISDYFRDGSRLDVNIEYSIEPEPLGTAGALRNAGTLLENEFLLLNGDTFSDIDYSEFVGFSRNRNDMCTMLCYNGKLFDDVKYNVIFKENHVMNYSKIFSDERFNAVDAGIYFMKKNILSVIKNRVSSLEEQIFPQLISIKQLSGFLTQTRFYDIGTIERLAVFNKMFGSKKTYNL